MNRQMPAVQYTYVSKLANNLVLLHGTLATCLYSHYHRLESLYALVEFFCDGMFIVVAINEQSCFWLYRAAIRDLSASRDRCRQEERLSG